MAIEEKKFSILYENWYPHRTIEELLGTWYEGVIKKRCIRDGITDNN